MSDTSRQFESNQKSHRLYEDKNLLLQGVQVIPLIQDPPTQEDDNLTPVTRHELAPVEVTKFERELGVWTENGRIEIPDLFKRKMTKVKLQCQWKKKSEMLSNSQIIRRGTSMNSNNSFINRKISTVERMSQSMKERIFKEELRIVLVRDRDLEVHHKVITGEFVELELLEFCKNIKGLDSLVIQSRLPQEALKMKKILSLEKVVMNVSGINICDNGNSVTRQWFRQVRFIDEMSNAQPFEIHLPPKVLFVRKLNITLESEKHGIIKLVRIGGKSDKIQDEEEMFRDKTTFEVNTDDKILDHFEGNDRFEIVIDDPGEEPYQIKLSYELTLNVASEAKKPGENGYCINVCPDIPQDVTLIEHLSSHYAKLAELVKKEEQAKKQKSLTLNKLSKVQVDPQEHSSFAVKIIKGAIMKRQRGKLDLIATAKEVKEQHGIDMNQGHDTTVDYRAKNNNRNDLFSGVCPCGNLDLVYIDAARGKLCRGNQFSSKYYGKKVFITETDLPDAKCVTFLEHVRVQDNFVFLIGYQNGQIEVRSSKSMKPLFKSRAPELDCRAVKKCSVYSEGDHIHLAVLIVQESNLQEKQEQEPDQQETQAQAQETETYTFIQYMLDSNYELKEEMIEKTYSESAEIFARRMGGLFNLLKQHSSRLYLNGNSNQLVILNVSNQCRQGKLQQIKSLTGVPSLAKFTLHEGIRVKTKSEIQNVFVLDDGSLILIGSKNIEFWRRQQNSKMAKKIVESIEKKIGIFNELEENYVQIQIKDVAQLIFDSALTTDQSNLLVATRGGGLIRFQLDLDAPKAIELQVGTVLKIEMSPCGRFFATGEMHKIRVYHQNTFENLVSIKEKKKNSCTEIRMQNSQLIFFKRQTGWAVMNILENEQTTTLKGFPIVLRTKDLNRGIIASREFYHPRTVLGIYDNQDGEVFAERLLVYKQYCLLTKNESQRGWQVKDVSLLQGTLTWLKLKVDENNNTALVKVCYIELRQKQLDLQGELFEKRVYLEKTQIANLILLTKMDDPYQAIICSPTQKIDVNLKEEDRAKAIIYHPPTLINDKYSAILCINIENNDNKIRVSPGMRFAVIQQNANQIQVAKLKRTNLDDDDSNDDQAATYSLKDPKEVRYFIRFEELTFLSDAHFAAPNQDKTLIGFYSTDSGEIFCNLKTSEFLLLKPSTVDNGSYPLVTGILDKRTNKIYPACAKSLLHFNCSRTHLKTKDMKHRDDLNVSSKIEILGLPAPALFPVNIQRFERAKTHKEKAVLVKQAIFQYSVWRCENKGGKNVVNTQNMLEYLLKFDLASPLENWAEFTTLNYLECGTNPLIYLKMNCAPLILDYFRFLVSIKQYALFQSIEIREFQQLLRLPNNIMYEYFELFSEPSNYYVNTRGKMTGNITHIDRMFQLRNDKEKLKEVESILFTHGTEMRQFQGYRIMVKLNLTRGTNDSITLLSDLYHLGSKSDIFMTMTIQKLLDYKFHQWTNYLTSFVYHSKFAASLYFILAWNNPNPNTILAIAIADVGLTIFDFSRHHRDLKQINFWFWMSLDLFGITSCFLYYAASLGAEGFNTNNQIMTASSYSCMVLAGFLRSMRILLNFKEGRRYISLIEIAIIDQLFPLTLLAYLGMTFAASFYKYDKSLNQLHYRDGPAKFYFARELLTSFGYGDLHLEEFSGTEWFLWVSSLLLTTVLVLNLAIGRMSDSLAAWNETYTRHSYFQQCELCYQMESFFAIYHKIRCTTKKKGEQQAKHLVFCQAKNQGIQENDCEILTQKIEEQGLEVNRMVTELDQKMDHNLILQGQEVRAMIGELEQKMDRQHKALLDHLEKQK